MKCPQEGLSDNSLAEAAGLLRLDVADLTRICQVKRRLPLARSATPQEAVLIEQTLASIGLETIVVSDQALAVEESPPQRLKKIDLRESEFVAHYTSGLPSTSIEWSAITLTMAGRLFAKRVQFKERKRRGPEKEIVDTSETTSDEAVLDIYAKNQDGGWRIMANNFDFSCLGDQKTLLAGENFSTLAAVIRDHSPQAEYDNSYLSLRRVLELVWPSEQETASLGWQRDGAGKYSTSEATLTTNESQFTRYSRLCHFLKVTSLNQQ